MHRSIIVASLLSCALLGACVEETGDSQLDPETPLAESVAAVSGRGYCSGSGNPPTVYDRWGSGSSVPTKWCDNARVTGWYGAVLYSGTNWAVCQGSSPANGWIVWTQGDSGWGVGNGWDWFPARNFSGGESGGPIPGLINCSAYGF